MAGVVNAGLGGIGPAATGGARGVQLLAQEFQNPVVDWLSEQAGNAIGATLVVLVGKLSELNSGTAREQFGVVWEQMTSALSQFGGRVAQLAGALRALSPEQRQVFVQSLGARLTQAGSPVQLEGAVRGALRDARRVRVAERPGATVQPSATRVQVPPQAQVQQSKSKSKTPAAQVPAPGHRAVNPGAPPPPVRPNPGAASLTGFTRQVAVDSLQAMVRTPEVISALAFLGVKSGAVPPALQPRQLGTLAGLEKHKEQLSQLKGVLGKEDWARLSGGGALENELVQVTAQIARVRQALMTSTTAKESKNNFHMAAYALVEATINTVYSPQQLSSLTPGQRKTLNTIVNGHTVAKAQNMPPEKQWPVIIGSTRSFMASRGLQNQVLSASQAAPGSHSASGMIMERPMYSTPIKYITRLPARTEDSILVFPDAARPEKPAVPPAPRDNSALEQPTPQPPVPTSNSYGPAHTGNQEPRDDSLSPLFMRIEVNPQDNQPTPASDGQATGFKVSPVAGGDAVPQPKGARDADSLAPSAPSEHSLASERWGTFWDLNVFVRDRSPELTGDELHRYVAFLWREIGQGASREHILADIDSHRGRTEIKQELARGSRNFDGWNLKGADLNFSLEGASFKGADLRDAFSSTKGRFVGADFRGADLRAAFCGDAQFVGADFRGANLKQSTELKPNQLEFFA
jgi:hypothetical protein